MAQVNLPFTLGPGFWKKQESALAKVPKAPSTTLGKELTALANLHIGIDWGAFGDDKLDTVAKADTRLSELEAAAKGKIKALTDQAQTVETVAGKFETDAKKDKQFPKEPLAAASSIAKTAKEYRSDVGEAVASARKALAAKVAALTAQQKKAAPAPGTGKPGAESKASKFIRTRALECIRKIKKPAKGAKPWRFLVVQGKLSVTVAMVPLASTMHEKMLKSLIPTENPYKTFKDPKGEVIWEKNAVTLVSDRLPLGLAKKMQLWLKKLTKVNAKIRIRKTTGEAEESDEGGDIPDDLLKEDPAEAAARKQAGKDFEKRLGELAPEIKKAMAEPLPAEIKDHIKELIDSIQKHGKAGEFEDAVDELDEIEAALEDAANAGTGDDSGFSADDLRKAKQAWSDSRRAAVKGVTELVGALLAAFKDETGQKKQVSEAALALAEVSKKLNTVTLEKQLDDALAAKDAAARAQLAAKAKATVESLMKMLTEDKIIPHLDNNEIISSMTIVKPMRDSLEEIEAHLS